MQNHSLELSELAEQKRKEFMGISGLREELKSIIIIPAGFQKRDLEAKIEAKKEREYRILLDIFIRKVVW